MNPLIAYRCRPELEKKQAKNIDRKANREKLKEDRAEEKAAKREARQQMLGDPCRYVTVMS